MNEEFGHLISCLKIFTVHKRYSLINVPNENWRYLLKLTAIKTNSYGRFKFFPVIVKLH